MTRIGCMRKAVTIEKQEETGMRLKLLSPGEMSAEQKETYDEAICRQARRPAGADDGLAQQPRHGAARHAARRAAALQHDFSGKLSEIAILVTARHWTSHYEWFAHKRLALKGGMDPKIIEDIRDRRTPTSMIRRAR